jgi:beta-lactamase class A
MPITQHEFSEAMDTFFTGLGGPVGVYVDHLDTDLVLHYNADELYPTASTLKTPLLYELYRQAEAGKVNLTDRVTLSHENRVPGSGVLQDLDAGLQPTIRDLAELMIIVSDNWATDLLYSIIGRDAMAATLRDLGMGNTYIPLNIREMFCLIAGKEFDDASVTYDVLKDALKHSEPDADCLAYLGDPRNNVSSPRDMGMLMRIIHEGQGISADDRERVIQTLKNQNFNTVIPGRLPLDRDIEVAHKTGSLRGVRADVGIVYAPEANYIIAVMSKQQTDAAETVDRLAHASRWVWDRLTSGD